MSYLASGGEGVEGIVPTAANTSPPIEPLTHIIMVVLLRVKMISLVTPGDIGLTTILPTIELTT